MVNVKELERRWFKYKLKKYLPFGIITLLTLIAILIFSLTNKSELKKTDNTPIKIQKEPAKIALPKKKIQNHSQQKQPLSSERSKPLEPSLEFLKKMKYNEIIPQQKTTSQKQKNLKVHRQPPKPTQKVPEEKIIHTKPIKKPTKEKRKSTLQIKTKQISENEIQEILQRFKKTNNPNLSLFVAKKYYELGNYNKAYNYALITNEIDNTIEESWIVFAKSLVKLGYKQRAVKTLQAYINYSHSSQAKLLLNKITTGKFK